MDIATIIATAVYCIFEGIVVLLGLAALGFIMFWAVMLVLSFFGF